MDSDWLVAVELDNARISCRISASRCGAFDVLIYVTDANEMKSCLLLRSFLLTTMRIRIIRESRTLPLRRLPVPSADFSLLACA